MLKKHIVLIAVIISLMFFGIASMLYPGGNIFDKNAVGFDWTRNFICNLFAPNAINGNINPSRIWAILGMLFISASFAIFFNHFSQKIPAKGAAKVIKYCGAIGMLFTLLIVTPYHDIMVNISGTMFLVCIFYITVYIFKSKLVLFKILCTLCMLIFYATFYIYGSPNLLYLLPVMQKLTFGISIVLILLLNYFSKKEDFL